MIIQHMQTNKCDTLHQQNDKNNMIISTEAKKAFEKKSTSFHYKKVTPKKLGVERMYLSIVKAIYERPTTNIILSGEYLKVFLLIP